MHLTLLESDRSFLRSTECAVVSIIAHLAMVWVLVGTTDGGLKLPADEREARVFFLLPPDRVETTPAQTQSVDWKTLGGDFAGGPEFSTQGAGIAVATAAPRSSRKYGRRSAARGELPFGPVATLRFDTAYSVLEVDQMVERYEGSAAPIYPPDLMAAGVEGLVQATYVVDTVGRVDTATIRVKESNDPRFTASVRVALGEMRFRPAKRAGRTVRQLVEQRFRFKILPPPVQPVDRS
jgi:TonB family protein